jgi:hypothetical protein
VESRRLAAWGAVLAVATWAGLAPPADARRVDVAPAAADTVDALGAALAMAQAGDSLFLAPGVYRGSHVVPHGVSLIGRAGPDSTILDAAGERWVLLGLDLDRTSVLAGLTLRHGRRDHPNSSGGGIHLRGSSPFILGNVFEDHLGYLGAGLYAFQGSRPIVANNVFRRCEGYLGGAVAAYVDCDLLLWNNVFYDNVGVSGGAILCMQSAAVITGNTIVANRAGATGGSAIYTGDEAPALVERNVLVRNVGSPAVYCQDAQRRATLRGNLTFGNDGEAGGACPAFPGTDGNCVEDPGLAPTSDPESLLVRRPEGSCAPEAGARPVADATAAVPDSVLASWRAWVAAHARDPHAAQDVGFTPAAAAVDESGRSSSPKIRNSKR